MLAALFVLLLLYVTAALGLLGQFLFLGRRAIPAAVMIVVTIVHIVDLLSGLRFIMLTMQPINQFVVRRFGRLCVIAFTTIVFSYRSGRWNVPRRISPTTGLGAAKKLKRGDRLLHTRGGNSILSQALVARSPIWSQ